MSETYDRNLDPVAQQAEGLSRDRIRNADLAICKLLDQMQTSEGLTIVEAIEALRRASDHTRGVLDYLIAKYQRSLLDGPK